MTEISPADADQQARQFVAQQTSLDRDIKTHERELNVTYEDVAQFLSPDTPRTDEAARAAPGPSYFERVQGNLNAAKEQAQAHKQQAGDAVSANLPAYVQAAGETAQQAGIDITHPLYDPEQVQTVQDTQAGTDQLAHEETGADGEAIKPLSLTERLRESTPENPGTWQQSTDLITDFVTELYILAGHNSQGIKDLYEAYLDWEVRFDGTTGKFPRSRDVIEAYAQRNFDYAAACADVLDPQDIEYLMAGFTAEHEDLELMNSVVPETTTPGRVQSIVREAIGYWPGGDPNMN